MSTCLHLTGILYILFFDHLTCRADFKTVQMETYPGWDISLHSRPPPAQLKEQISLTEKTPKASTSTKIVGAFLDVLSFLSVCGTQA